MNKAEPGDPKCPRCGAEVEWAVRGDGRLTACDRCGRFTGSGVEGRRFIDGAVMIGLGTYDGPTDGEVVAMMVRRATAPHTG